MTAACLFGGRLSGPGVVWRTFIADAAFDATSSGVEGEVLPDGFDAIGGGGAVNGSYHRTRDPGLSVPELSDCGWGVISPGWVVRSIASRTLHTRFSSSEDMDGESTASHSRTHLCKAPIRSRTH